jgi:RimJ/RimL family protein N-acetyltransferase
VGPAYVSWLSDPEVTRSLESRHNPAPGIRELLSFVEGVNASTDNMMLGIFLKATNRHIGNIKLGPIHPHHRRAEIGFLIGEKDCWGQGYVSEAIAALSRYGLDELHLDKITSGCYETNIGSAKALLKAGFTQEARIPLHVIVEGRRVASLLFGLDQSPAKRAE